MITFDPSAGTQASDYVKVPFKEAISLVGRKSVFIRKGVAFVPLRELYSIASAHFRAKVSLELVKASKHIGQITARDPRMKELLEALGRIN